jgi:endo-1,4-beta-xylanase
MSPSTLKVLGALVAVSLLAAGCGRLASRDVPAVSPADVALEVYTSEDGLADARETAAGGAGGAASGVGGAGTGGATGTATSGASGVDGATGPGNAKFVGNIDTSRSIRSDFATYWNQFTPENAGKWGSVQRQEQSAFNWASLDAMYQYCNEHNIVFKQHNFVWGSQQPSWANSLDTSTGPAAVQNWMNSFCQRYPTVQLIDVVNEPPPHTTPAYADAIGGGTNTTWDWIVNAFRWARQACPNAILILNDYSNAEDSNTAQHNIDIVNAIKAAGAPIDAVGCQLHDAMITDSITLKTNIDMIAKGTGLPVYITEYDIDTADDAEQERVMRDEFTMFWTNDNIKGVTLWGYIVGHTWRANTGLVQDDGTMRPAMTWLMNYLGR